MKIDTSAIANFESMSADEKVNALLGYEIEEKKDFSDEYAKAKKRIDELTKENAEQKRTINASKSKEEIEKSETEERFKEMTEKYNALVKENSISKNASRYRTLGFNETLANDTAEAMFAGDEERVFKNFEKFKEDYEKFVKAEIVKGTPKPEAKGSSTPSEMTKEQFSQLTYTERVKIATENPELYEKLR